MEESNESQQIWLSNDTVFSVIWSKLNALMGKICEGFFILKTKFISPYNVSSNNTVSFYLISNMFWKKYFFGKNFLEKIT